MASLLPCSVFRVFHIGIITASYKNVLRWCVLPVSCGLYKLHSGQEGAYCSCYTHIVHYNNIGSMADFLLECFVFLLLFAFRTIYKAFCGCFVLFIGSLEQFFSKS